MNALLYNIWPSLGQWSGSWGPRKFASYTKKGPGRRHQQGKKEVQA